MQTQFRMIDRSGPQEPSVKFVCEIMPDESPDLSFLEQDYNEELPRDRAKYLEQDRLRIAAYNRGDWHMTGIRARADILIPAGGNAFAMYTLTSPGVWGVESDCGEGYQQELYGDELDTLKAHMRALAAVFQTIRDEVQ